MAKELKFDLTNTSTSGPLILPGVYTNAVAKASVINTISQVLEAKDIVKIGQMTFGNFIKDSACAQTATSLGALSQKTVTLCTLDIFDSICQETLETSFISNRMKAGQNNADFLPADFEAFLKEEIAKRTALILDTIIFTGNPEDEDSVWPATLCPEGLIVQMLADSGIIDIAKATVTSSNVIAELNKIYSAIPAALQGNPDLTIYVSNNIAAAYKQAQGATTGGLFMVGDKELNFLGVKMIMAPGLPANTAIATVSTNLFFLTDLLSDFQDVKVIPQLDTTGQHTVVISGRFKVAFSYINPTEIVLYS